jgi:hypothetical protein
MKYLKLAIGLVILSAFAAWARPSAFRGDRFQIGGAESVRSMTVSIDSLGASAINLYIFKTPRGMLFTGAAVVSKTAFVGVNVADSSDATVKVKSGATIFSVNVDSGDVWQDYRPGESGWAHFDSAVTCTLAVDDGLAPGTGGLSAQVIFWYNDDYTNR